MESPNGQESPKQRESSFAIPPAMNKSTIRSWNKNDSPTQSFSLQPPSNNYPISLNRLSQSAGVQKTGTSRPVADRRSIMAANMLTQRLYTVTTNLEKPHFKLDNGRANRRPIHSAPARQSGGIQDSVTPSSASYHGRSNANIAAAVYLYFF
jgi:hypothetical protein